MNRVAQIKRESIKTLIASLTKQYEAKFEQMACTLDASQKVILQKGLDTIEKEIGEYEEQLKKIDVRPKSTNATDVATDAQVVVENVAGVGNAVTIVNGDQVNKSVSVFGKLMGLGG